MGQGKARPAGNGDPIAKGRNAALAHARGLRRTSLGGSAPSLHSLALAMASASLVRLGADPPRHAETNDLYGAEH